MVVVTNRPTINRIVELQQLIADFAAINRVPELADKKRKENDVEHSYGLALTVWYLAMHIAPDLNQEKLLKYALAHDLVELHAGDTFTFGDKELIASKTDREIKAVAQLNNDWPDFPQMAQYAKDYMDKVDAEARFVYATDKLLPVIMVNLGEKEQFWTRHKVTLEMMKLEKESRMKISEYFGPYYEEFIEWITNPNYFYKN